MSNCRECDKGNKLITPFWDSPYHEVFIKATGRFVKAECGNRQYDEGCPGCGGQRGHWGECK